MTEETPRRGRRALFSDPVVDRGPAPTAVPPDPAPLRGRRALFSATEPPSAPPSARSDGRRRPRLAAVVHCRTCLAATPLSLPALGLALVPSLWIPGRPWSRLMRCPACHRVSWCRVDRPRFTP